MKSQNNKYSETSIEKNISTKKNLEDYKNSVKKIKHFQFSLKQFFYLYIYIGFLIVGFIGLPNKIAMCYEARIAIVGLGTLGLWRYCWWFIHAVRSLIYTYIVFPGRRVKADELWNAGWRPKRLFFMMTTFKELPATTEIVLQSIMDACAEVSVPVHLFVGIGAASDEEIIMNYLNGLAIDFPFTVKLVQQKLPGKRFAIGETLRAIVAAGLKQDDPVIFMDGDTFLMPVCLQQCLPFFALFPKLQALTTHEQSIIINGPAWMKKWLDMRFAQRDFTMRSYSLSGKILALTGRMSIFRGKHLLEPKFIDIVEYDHLEHWLWGKFRFLSGDDKSTWYYLLQHRADMFYVPDALTVTIEHISGNALKRMNDNLRRWSGNTLRNGARAIALGPKTVGWYIWWCLVDQRIAIWTLPIGLTITCILTLTKTPYMFLASVLWLASSRLLISSMLFYYARRIDMSFPFIVYFNQLMSSIIKIHILFRLPQQRWKNRGDQQVGFEEDKKLKVKRWIASYLTTFYCVGFLLIILIYLGFITLPTLSDIKVIF